MPCSGRLDEPPAHITETERATVEARVRGGWDAFISYSHSADADLAPALRDGLHKLAKPWHHKRAMRVFLDDASLSADPTLWTPIARAIDASSGFVALLSPEAAASIWVNREIRQWVDRCGSDRFFPVLTRGELVWDEALGDYDPERSSALPEALRGVFAEEPRHVDVRWADGRLGLTLNNLEFRDAVAELAAPLRNVPKDELIGSDLEEHQRAMRLARSAIAVLSVLLVAALVAAVFARSNAVRADNRRVDTQAARLRLESLNGINRPDIGFLLAAEAYRLRPDSAASAAVVATVQRTPDLRRYIRAHTSRIVAVGVTTNSGTVLSLDRSGLLVSTDVTTGKTLATAVVEQNGSAIAATADQFIVSGVLVAQLRDARTLEVKRTWTVGADKIFASVVFLENGSAVFVSQEGMVATTSLTEPKGLVWVQTPQKLTYGLAAVAGSRVVTYGFNADDHYTVDAMSVDDPSQTVWRTPISLQPTSMSMSADRSLVIIGTLRGAFIVLDAATGKATGQPKVISASAVRAIASSPALGQYQMVVTDSGVVRYIDAAQLSSFQGELLHAGAATALAWSRGGIAVSGGADGVVTILDTGVNREPGAADLGLAAPALAMTADGGRTVAVVGDEVVEIATPRVAGSRSNASQVDAALLPAALPSIGRGVAAGAGRGTTAKGTIGASSRRTLGRVANAWSVTVTAAGAAVGDEHGTIHLLSATASGGAAATVKEVTANVGFDTPVLALQAVDDGRLVSLTSNQLLQVWRMRDGRLVLDHTLSDRASAFGIQGGNGPFVAYFEVASGLVVVGLDGTERTRIPAEYPLSLAVAIDPTGRTAATADASLVHVWDLSRGVELGTAIDAPGDVRAVHFVDGGRRLVMVDSQSSVELVDVGARTSRGRLSDEDGPPFVGFASSDSSEAFVVASNSGRAIRSLRRTFDPVALIHEGCALFGRPFTDAERAKFDLGKRDDPCRA